MSFRYDMTHACGHSVEVKCKYLNVNCSVGRKITSCKGHGQIDRSLDPSLCRVLGTLALQSSILQQFCGHQTYMQTNFQINSWWQSATEAFKVKPVQLIKLRNRLKAFCSGSWIRHTFDNHDLNFNGKQQRLFI